MVALSLLGSTGSIGKQTLDVADGLRRGGAFEIAVKVLAARRNIKLLEEQIRQWRPEAVAVYEEDAARELRDRVRDLDVKILPGREGLCEAAAYEGADITLNAVVGMIGLEPTLAALKAKKRLALANKETLVAGGGLVMETARENGIDILPVDSEHSAIFQCVSGDASGKAVKKLILTASGGPFYGMKSDMLEDVTPEQALRHPNWDMGAKITVDSATMMNKGLEVIEASWLFNMAADDIEVVVHRESIVHSLVEFEDNAVLAQLGVPDMAIPIQYSLTYPNRYPSPAKEIKLWELRELHFDKPDEESFQCLPICIEAIRRGGLCPAAVNGANEAAVQLFLDGKIGFTDISRLAAGAMENQSPLEEASELSSILEADRRAREYVLDIVGK